MSHNDNTSAQMLLFPVQRTTDEELAACDDIHVLYWQARLATLDAVRRFSEVEDLSSQSVRDINQLINNFNAIAVEFRYPTLNIHFD